MNIPDAKYFKLHNAFFCHKLMPIQRAVYSYLVCCAGQKGRCWPSMSTIAEHCCCSKNAARAAVDVLAARGFIRKQPTFKEQTGRRSRQTNNTYFILELPNLPSAPPQEVYYATPSDGGELYQQDEGNKLKDLSTPKRRTLGQGRNVRVG